MANSKAYSGADGENELLSPGGGQQMGRIPQGLKTK
jgi:hypothetical protein